MEVKNNMKEVIYNRDNLKEEDMTETVIRTKALLINGDSIFIGNENSVFQFPGGHLEENESFEECLKREIEEESGIKIDLNDIKGPFMKVIYMNRNWPEEGTNRKNEIYYYVVKTNKEPDLSKTTFKIFFALAFSAITFPTYFAASLSPPFLTASLTSFDKVET